MRLWLYVIAALTGVGMSTVTFDAFKNGGIGQGCICAALTMAVVGTIVGITKQV